MKKITIVEDNLEVRENLVEILTLSGYEVTQAENGIEGIKVIKSILPDLILCDVMMPELDGFGVLKILNNSPELMHIPFMFLTAKAEKSDFRKGMGLGADDYITKPFDDVELLEAIEMRLSKSSKLKAIENTEHGLRQFFDEAKGQKALELLSEEREIRKYSKKEIIFEEGQNPKWLFFIVSGKIKSYKTNELGKELITRVYSAGDFFGFNSLLLEEKYDSSTMSIEDVVLRLIPIEDFKLLLFNNRDFAAKFIKMLAKHADHNEKQLIDLAYSSVRKKLANALLTLSKTTDQSLIKISREDLASLAGTAKETTIRTLSDFKSEKIILVSNQGIEILDFDSLNRMPQ